MRSHLTRIEAPSSIYKNKVHEPTEDLVVEKAEFRADPGEEEGSVWINKGCSVLRSSRMAWDYRIGNIRVLSSWIRAREGITLDYNDLAQLRAIQTALENTLRIEEELGRMPY